ncbi:MAG: vitamin B12 dependent-methionine synthase activation domain-containing protein [Bacteroidota bacterium]
MSDPGFQTDPVIVTPRPEELRVDRAAILKQLQVPPGAADPYLTDLIDKLIESCLKLADPRGCFAVYPSPDFSEKGKMILAGETFGIETQIWSSLKKSTCIACFICTAGDEIEKYARELFRRGDSLEGLIVDLAGSELAEAVAEIVNRRIGDNLLEKQLRITNRYSPGYCSWPVSDQEKLFRLVPGEKAGVALNASALMTPVKSVSGVIGGGPGVSYRQYNCRRCSAEQCIYRDKQAH